MEPITVAATLGAIWSLFEIMGKAFFDETVKVSGKPYTNKIAKWFQKITKIAEKERYEAFVGAYINAEQKLIAKYGIEKAMRVFSKLPRFIDLYKTNQSQVFSSLFIDDIIADIEIQNIEYLIRDFMVFLREELSNIELYRPLIEFFREEKNQEILKQIENDLSKIAKTIDQQLGAIKVVVVEPQKDFLFERKKYLKQLESIFLEHQFLGFPIHREEKNPTLLREMFVVLDLRREIKESYSKLPQGDISANSGHLDLFSKKEELSNGNH